jgi:putative nucleotidyltransferase with HDIG domain
MAPWRILRASLFSVLVAGTFAAGITLLGSHVSSAPLLWLSLGVAAFASGAVAVTFFDVELGAEAGASASPTAVPERPTALVLGLEILILAVALTAIPLVPYNSWNVDLLIVLLGFSALSGLVGIKTEKVYISGNFLAIVLAMVFLGGGPAALLGLVTIILGQLRWLDKPADFLSNLVTYAVFPLASGLAFRAVVEGMDISVSDPSFYAFTFAVFWFALAMNFVLIAAYASYLDRTAFSDKVGLLRDALPSELGASAFAVATAVIYTQVGLGALACSAVSVVGVQYLLRNIFEVQLRTQGLEDRNRKLASFQIGVLSGLLRTLDLRDQMTARHSAAVARYSRAIAQRAGYSQREQELVHIAGLLHDIGKFILPEHILGAREPLTDEDWKLVRRHPQQGATIVSALDGYGPVAELILAHHERIDGKGYPRGLAGGQIPELARIIAVAEAYDAMTARDSYQAPVSSSDAVREMRRVAGRQFDSRFVEVFSEMLEADDVAFQSHRETVDIEELESEMVIAETARTKEGTGGSAPPERGLLVTNSPR